MKQSTIMFSVGGAIVALIILMIMLLAQPAANNEPEAYPVVRSVVIDDGRTVCEKRSELVLVREWERLCEKAGNDKHCSLDKQTADQARIYQQLSLETCNGIKYE